MRNSKFANLMFTIIAGMGNVKRGYWPGILLYLSVMVLLGAALVFVERIYIEPIYQLPQSVRTFAALIFVAFTFFWDGTYLQGYAGRNHNIENKEDSSSKEKSRVNQHDLSKRSKGINPD